MDSPHEAASTHRSGRTSPRTLVRPMRGSGSRRSQCENRTSRMKRCQRVATARALPSTSACSASRANSVSAGHVRRAHRGGGGGAEELGAELWAGGSSGPGTPMAGGSDTAAKISRMASCR
jgi:hypothetical protein